VHGTIKDHADIAKFISAAVTALAGEGKAEVARLAVDARPIATMVVLRSGATNDSTVWAWKIAHDEDYARFSPGMQILLDVTQVLLDDRTVARADSCAGADHPMSDHIWRERLARADRLVCVGPCDLRSLTASKACAGRQLRPPRRCGICCAAARYRRSTARTITSRSGVESPVRKLSRDASFQPRGSICARSTSCPA
jgi:hypothetical protein